MARRRKGRRISGILLLDKPAGMSSNAALQKVKWLFKAAKAGHTGSLDPLATGLLPVCLGEATKASAFLLDADKRYVTTVRLGEKTSTADAEGEVIETVAVPVITLEHLSEVLERFLGEIEQLPPMYSALKHQGKRLYELARETVAEYPVYQPVHNVLFLATTELGFVGGALWLGLLVAPWLALWAKRHQLSMGPWWAGLSGALVGLYVVGFFDHYPWSSHQGRLLLWLVWGLWAGEWTRDTKLEKTL